MNLIYKYAKIVSREKIPPYRISMITLQYTQKKKKKQGEKEKDLTVAERGCSSQLFSAVLVPYQMMLLRIHDLLWIVVWVDDVAYLMNHI